MATHIDIYETEQGDPITITGRNYNDSANADLSWGVEGDSTVEIKTRDDTVVLTLTGTTDFTFSNPVVTWTPNDTQISALTKNIKYNGFAHIRNNATPRERVLKFTLTVLNS